MKLPLITYDIAEYIAYRFINNCDHYKNLKYKILKGNIEIEFEGIEVKTNNNVKFKGYIRTFKHGKYELINGFISFYLPDETWRRTTTITEYYDPNIHSPEHKCNFFDFEGPYGNIEKLYNAFEIYCEINNINVPFSGTEIIFNDSDTED